ncbi:MAG: hypothetical protein JXA25_13465 [Anaerolineales bacterium]|nr:hypothetical protein [Anaerolineales bacterium]
MAQKQNRVSLRALLLLLIGVVILLIVGVLWFSRNAGSDEPGVVIPAQIDSTGEESGLSTEAPDDGTTLTVRLSEGQDHPEQVEPVPLAIGEPLSADTVLAILSRLPALAPEPDSSLDFRLPEDVIPPPRTGETISQSFPPDEDMGPATVESGPLEVLRYAPEGEVPIAPFVNITFNQPMVELATVDDLAAADIPVQIKPEPPGTWRWLGTRTLNFQADSELIDRLPMSTEYTVTIPAGTLSAVGGVLEETVTFSFVTPTALLTETYPSVSPQPRDPLFFLAFNQRIDQEAVLATIKVTARNQQFSIRLATEEEIANDKTVRGLIDSAAESRWLAFKTEEQLPLDSDILVLIGPGTPSAEGALLTTDQQSFSFQTYAPLRIEDHGCSWYDGDCPPLTPFYIEFNNPLDLGAYDEEMLRISPELPGASVNIYEDMITISGATAGRTTYRVTVDGTIQDIFGQTLGRDEVLKFKVGSAQSALIGPDQNFVTLDPSASDPALDLYSINYDKLDVQIYAVQPSDWAAFQEYMYEFDRSDTPPDPPGTLVQDGVMQLDTPADTLTEIRIELSDYIDGESGHFIVIAKPQQGIFEEDRYWETVRVWVQVTRIGLDAFVDHSEIVVWTNALQDGSPLSDVRITSGPGGSSQTSGLDGTVRFDIPSSGVSYLVAEKQGDRALLPASTWYWGDESWVRRTPQDSLRWLVFDDRQMYRPGEEVHLKGWLRQIGGGQDGDVGLAGSKLETVSYQLYGPQGNEIGNGQIDVNALGGFDLTLTLPENTNLGYAQLVLNAEGALGGLDDGRQYYHSFQIQEFRRPEFEVSARTETTGPVFIGGYAVAAVEAAYYTGDPLPGAEVSWNVMTSPGHYQPPNWPDFTFGSWTPWWYYESDYTETEYTSYTGQTDASGTHYLRMDFDETSSLRPLSVLAEGTVYDVNRQAWTGTTSLLVHPAEYYVGMRSDRYFVERGTPLAIELIVTDLDGEAVVDRPIDVTAARMEWKYQNGRWQQVEADVQECTVGSQTEPVSCSFETPIGGSYQITAEVTDSMGRRNQSRFTRWVSGGQQAPARDVEQESLTLIPDKETYQPGDVAEILVQAPFSPAEGLLTVTRSGLLYTERFTIEDGSCTLHVPIEEKHIPNLNIQVDVVGSAARTDDAGELLPDVAPRPAYASGQLTLSIPPLERTLALEVIPDEKELEPGGETMLNLVLKDADGNPVSDAELAVVVVDEAILALTGYQLGDPLAAFYQDRPSWLESRYSRSSIILVDPMTLAAAGDRGGGFGMDTLSQAEGEVMEEAAMEAPMPTMVGESTDSAWGGEGAASEAIHIRMDFNPLATFAPQVRTAEDGTASVRVNVPDNLTRYRVMVVAVDSGGRQFGSAETSLTSRLPLMVRPSAPRFLNFGDVFELPVVLQNQTDEPLTVEVALRTVNLELTGDNGLLVDVPAHDRIEVRFPAAADRAGTARFQVAAVSGSYADAATLELPVYTPATTEAFATYGVIDEGAVTQPVSSPEGVFAQYGGLEITTSSTALQSLTDAVLYLVSYPYECSEQLASRILGIAALRDVLTAFEAEGLPPAADIEAAVQRDIERLQGLQNWDGGFPYWRRGQESIPFNTIHTAHALQQAKSKGFDVPGDMLERMLYYLRDIESYYPSWYSLHTRQTLSAYALSVRTKMGDRDAEKARSLLREAGLEELSLDAVGWIWQTLIDDPGSAAELEQIRLYINNRVVETAGAANFTTDYDDQSYLLLSSNRRTDGILLDALIRDNPQSDLIPKLVTGLQAHRTRGHWGNTQENVFVLLSLDRYFNTFEAQTPDFVARIWLGETYAGEHVFEGRTTERIETDIPMAYLVDEAYGGGETQDLILSKDGDGRLYYRLGLRYAPEDLDLDPIDMGFVVQRVYEAVDDPEDVRQGEDGTWYIRAGARVRIRLTMVADNRRYHVALVDPLPAGLEIVNPALAVSASTPQDPDSSDYRYGWWWWGTWYEHQNMRDERAEAFTPLLWDGVYEYTYIARATTPGSFVVPPAKAEEMYSPEVFGRSASDRVIVE